MPGLTRKKNPHPLRLRRKHGEGNSPAASAGLKPGDIITKLDGEPIQNAYSAFNHIAGQLPGTEVSITGLRGGDEFTTRVKIAERPAGLN